MSSDSENSIRFGAEWLLRLRWIALVGQLALCFFSGFWLQIQLPWKLLLSCMLLVGLSNLAAQTYLKRGGKANQLLLAVLIFGDISILTVMLFYAGGAHNPFTLFYILHIALVAILLPSQLVFAALATSGIGFWVLLRSPYELVSASGESCCNNMDMHLQGMVLATILTGAAVSYFVTRLSASLREANALLTVSQKAYEEKQRFNSLATLAAGVAHELATPLGTIAVVGKELERTPDEQFRIDEVRSDLRLIRQEVDRCRAVIERLGESARIEGSEKDRTFRLEMLPPLLDEHIPIPMKPRVAWSFGALKTPTLSTHLTGLLQTLAVLVKNACEASDNHQAVEIAVSSDESYVTFAVKDSGIGMNAETLDRLGEPFFTRKSGGAGMGLGIFLARMFCEERGGFLRFTSTHGAGTTATCCLPIQYPNRS